MNPIICVIPYCQKDLELAKNLLKWIGELNGCGCHSCVLIADSNVSKEERLALKELAIPSFFHVESLPVNISTFGFAPNHMFMSAAQQMMLKFKQPWLWLEPDAVPLREGWLDAISKAYDLSPKRFLGSLISADQPGLPATHLSGVAVYPNDAFPIFDAFASLKSANVAWDMETALDVVPRAAHSDLFQHFWGKQGMSPTFVKDDVSPRPENGLPFSFIRPDAALFHRNKDGTLINLLRERLNAPQEQSSQPIIPEIPKRRGRPPKHSPAITSNP